MAESCNSVFLKPYTDTDAAWTNIGRLDNGVAPEMVQQRIALRPPLHVTSYMRLAPHSNKGITDSGLCSLVFLVLEEWLYILDYYIRNFGSIY